MGKKKIIVAHPFRQHSFKLAEAVNLDNSLFSYCTTVYDKQNSSMRIVKFLLKGDLLRKASGRKCDGIEDHQVKLFCEKRGFLALLINRYCKNENIKKMYQRYLYRCFGKKVAKYAIKNCVDMVITYDTTATACFSYLKKKASNIECVLDMAAISRQYAKYIYEKEDSGLGLHYFRRTQSYLWNDRIIKYMGEEIYLADRFISASQFTADSLIFCGRDKKKISIIPYGIDLMYYEKIQHRIHEKFTVVFAGHVDYQKGVHYLLEAVKDMSPNEIQVDLYGVYNDTSELYLTGRKMENVAFKGFVNKETLTEAYSSADVFVFPSTNDGFGFVILEAMACGCPIICSKNVGSCDLIEEGRNGFLFDSGDVDTLKNHIVWCMKNREKLRQFGEKSKKIVQDYTWDKYNQRVKDFISSF